MIVAYRRWDLRVRSRRGEEGDAVGIVDEAQRRYRPQLPICPQEWRRNRPVCGVAPPPRWANIVSSSRLASGPISPPRYATIICYKPLEPTLEGTAEAGKLYGGHGDTPPAAWSCRASRASASRLVTCWRRSRCSLTQTLFEPHPARFADEAMRQNSHCVATGQRPAHVVSELDLGRVYFAPGSAGAASGARQCVALEIAYASPRPRRTLDPPWPAAARNHKSPRA